MTPVVASDGRTIYHGIGPDGTPDWCGWEELQTFRCTACRRLICYCGGHDGFDDACPKCDDCCATEHAL